MTLEDKMSVQGFRHGVESIASRLDHMCKLDIDENVHHLMGRMTGIIGTIGKIMNEKRIFVLENLAVMIK